MKAEHRKELQTNMLADKMGKLLSGAKTGGGLYVALAVVFLLLLVAYYWLPGEMRDRLTVTWFDFYNSTDNEESLQKNLERHRGTPIVVPTQLLQADHYYERGMELTRDPDAAVVPLKQAISLYKPLALDGTLSPVIQARAALGWAETEEAMYWITTDADPNANAIQRIIELYRDVTRIGGPELHAKTELHPLLARARDRIVELQKPEVAQLVLAMPAFGSRFPPRRDPWHPDPDPIKPSDVPELKPERIGPLPIETTRPVATPAVTKPPAPTEPKPTTPTTTAPLTTAPTATSPMATQPLKPTSPATTAPAKPTTPGVAKPG
jgi:hypothetical protein